MVTRCLHVIYILGGLCYGMFHSGQTFAQDSLHIQTPLCLDDSLLHPIPTGRAFFVDKIRAQIKQSDMKDGTVDQILELQNPIASEILTQSLLVDAPLIINHIENSKADNQTKIYYYRCLERLLKSMNALPDLMNKASFVKNSISNFDALLVALDYEYVPDFAQKNANIYTLNNADLLRNFPKEKAFVFETVGRENPVMMLERLPEYAKEPYADPIIAAAAKVVPGTILTYAHSTTYLSDAVRRNKDPLVRTIVSIANKSRNSLKLLPFIYQINDGTQTITALDDIADSPNEYFKALVTLKLQDKDKQNKALDEAINYRGLQLVRVVNELHESPAPIRFKSLMNFRAEDLYFMMIGSQEEIYTSSFIWMFDRMMTQMKPATSDVFLEHVNKNRFRTFIRMAAGFNKISDFLAAMDADHKNNLMKEFVSNLEKGSNDDLENAVDVADAFGSLNDPKLISFLKDEIQSNLRRQITQKGKVVYSLLNTIFVGADNTDKLNSNVSNLIPPITYVPQSALRDSMGRIVMQVFFYGDKDGMGAFNGYLSLFRNPKWKVVSGKYWTTVTATGPNQIMVFVNKPLPEEADENDVFAQNQLQDYLDEHDFHPSIVIHRGHSYYLPTTLEHLSSSAKIVVLGSCGGYHNLKKVLNASPDANIISSKQVGAYAVNTPILAALNDALLSGKDINWILMWQNLSKYFANRGAGINDLFSDYIPPNKNLGAIFIKAYRKSMPQSSLED